MLIRQRHKLSKRMNKFLRTQTTSPRFYDNPAENNSWVAKMQTLDRGKVPAILPTSDHIDSLHKLAEHIRGRNLIPAESVRDEIPKGFNKKVALDPITKAVGMHIHERSASLKAQRVESLALVDDNKQTTTNNNTSAVHTRLLTRNINQSSEKSMLAPNRSGVYMPRQTFQTPYSQKGRQSD